MATQPQQQTPVGTPVHPFEPAPPDPKLLEQQSKNAAAERLEIAQKIFSYSMPGGSGRRLADEEVPAPNPDWYNSYSGFGPVAKGRYRDLVQSRTDEDKSSQETGKAERQAALQDFSEQLEQLKADAGRQEGS